VGAIPFVAEGGGCTRAEKNTMNSLRSTEERKKRKHFEKGKMGRSRTVRGGGWEMTMGAKSRKRISNGGKDGENGLGKTGVVEQESRLRQFRKGKKGKALLIRGGTQVNSGVQKEKDGERKRAGESFFQWRTSTGRKTNKERARKSMKKGKKKKKKDKGKERKKLGGGGAKIQTEPSKIISKPRQTQKIKNKVPKEERKGSRGKTGKRFGG